jgi:hypothetical protein
LLPLRQQPINTSNLILIGQALFKAINKLPDQKASSAANLDSSEHARLLAEHLSPGHWGKVTPKALLGDSVKQFCQNRHFQHRNGI